VKANANSLAERSVTLIRDAGAAVTLTRIREYCSDATQAEVLQALDQLVHVGRLSVETLPGQRRTYTATDTAREIPAAVERVSPVKTAIEQRAIPSRTKRKKPEPEASKTIRSVQILRHLVSNGEQPIAAIAVALGLHRQRLSVALTNLQNHGRIYRKPPPNGGNAGVYGITEIGRQIAEAGTHRIRTALFVKPQPESARGRSQIQIARPEIKIAALRKLSVLVAKDIGDVLNDVASDLERITEPAA
jgi:DNA-binding MarR family transcriptional regulator